MASLVNKCHAEISLTPGFCWVSLGLWEVGASGREGFCFFCVRGWVERYLQASPSPSQQPPLPLQTGGWEGMVLLGRAGSRGAQSSRDPQWQGMESELGTLVYSFGGRHQETSFIRGHFRGYSLEPLSCWFGELTGLGFLKCTASGATALRDLGSFLQPQNT